MVSTFQNVLFRLMLDSDLRRQFCAAPERTLAPLPLSAEERATLRAIAPQALEQFAQALMQKRWSQVQRVIPLSRRVCPSLQRRYVQWLAIHPAAVEQTVFDPGTAEAWRALSSLHAALTQDQAEAPYGADLLAFEVLQRCARQDGQPRWLQSRFALHVLARDIASGMLPLEPDCVPSCYRFDRRGIQWQTQTLPAG